MESLLSEEAGGGAGGLDPIDPPGGKEKPAAGKNNPSPAPKGNEEKEEEEEEEEEEENDDPDGDDEPGNGKPKGKTGKGAGDGDGSEDDGGEEPMVKSIATALGFDLGEREEEFEDTEQGLTKLTREIAVTMAENELERIFSQHPSIQKHLDYVLAGGDPDKFFQTFGGTQDYSKLELAKEDVAVQRSIVTEYFKAKGHDEAFIKDTLTEYEDTGKLFDKAAVIQKELAKLQGEQREKLLKEQQAEHQAKVDKELQYWNTVQQTLATKEEFAGLQIPAKEKASFFEFIAVKTASGKSKRDEALAKIPVEQRLALDYILYKGLDLKTLVETKADTKAARTLRSKLKDTAAVSGKQAPVDKTKRFDPQQVDSATLFGLG